MDDKKRPPQGQTGKPTGPTAVRPASRHRFAEGETTILPLADILRSRDAAALSDPGLSGSVPAGWGQAKGELAAALQAAGSLPDEGNDATQVVSGFGTLRTEIRSRPSASRPQAGAETSVGHAPVVRTENLAVEAAQPLRAKANIPATPPPPAPSAPSVRGQLPSETAVSPGITAPTEGAGAAKSGAKVRNQVVVFFSCKGGSGATALSVNAAHTYARGNLSCCLVDLDLQMGDDMAALALKPKFTLAQAAAGAAAGDRIQRDMLPMHPSGLTVLSQVGSLSDLDTVSSENMAKLVEDLRETFDVVVLDGARDFNDNVLAVLDVADKICIVTVQEVLSIRRARWAFNILRKIGFDTKDITIVVNRFDPRSEVPLESVRAMFAPAAVQTVVAEMTPVLHSLNRGVPLQESNPNRPVTRQIAHLANSIVGIAAGDQATGQIQQQGSLFERMFRKLK